MQLHILQKMSRLEESYQIRYCSVALCISNHFRCLKSHLYSLQAHRRKIHLMLVQTYTVGETMMDYVTVAAVCLLFI